MASPNFTTNSNIPFNIMIIEIISFHTRFIDVKINGIKYTILYQNKWEWQNLTVGQKILVYREDKINSAGKQSSALIRLKLSKKEIKWLCKEFK